MVSKGYRNRLRRNAAGLVFECIYCGDVLGLHDFSEEHIWAERLGGEYGPDWFKTIFVCADCNSACGLHVDAEFALTFFATSELAISAFRFLDTTRTKPMPLIYFGRSVTGCPRPDDVCEYWKGPRGEAIYHFRNKSDPYFDVLAGGNPVQRRKNPGRVYMSLSNPNLFWVVSALKSLRSQFGRMKLFSLTRIDDPRLSRIFQEDDPQCALERRFIAQTNLDNSHRVQMTINLDWGQRYLCKLALSFGFQLFGHKFLGLPGTSQLRAAIAEKDAQKRAQLRVFGLSMLGSSKAPYAQAVSFDGAFVLLFWRSGRIAGLSVITPTGKEGSVRITDAADRLQSPMLDRYGGSFVVLLVPSLKRHWGPFSLVDYIAHRLGDVPIAELTQLEERRRSRSEIEKELAKYPVGNAA